MIFLICWLSGLAEITPANLIYAISTHNDHLLHKLTKLDSTQKHANSLLDCSSESIKNARYRSPAGAE